MDSTTVSNKPIETLRDSRLKASIWENASEKGPYYTVSLAKIYEDKDGHLQETQSFSASELLRVAELAREAHGVVRDLKRERSLERNTDQQAEQGSNRSRSERPARFRR
ncbi:hypothetical protein [Marinibacterium profundimaris]|uniref:Uncharacterized protein n=1 Tax=Marinibacterium profundimaris TaxID=1679460 RepID=A0A225ND49_9RHOB|nr:hypothetical protein [Marinibacterium profundimaris]OWU67818.1 hypothetical protein ATO3_25660 [Marinibacterium profundimaris]